MQYSATISLKMSSKKLLCAFVLSRLDYSNSLLAGCPKYLLSKLRKVQNNAARLIFGTIRSAHVSHSYASFSSLATYWAEDRIQIVFALRSFLIRPPATFQNFFTFTLLPGAALLFYRHPSVQNIILLNKVLWSAIFLLPGSSYLEPTPCFCPPFYLCQLF